MSSPLYPAQWLLFLALYRAYYETANSEQNAPPVERSPAEQLGFVPSTESNGLAIMTPREREWADKANRRYAQAQEKKWRRWNEAMFEANVPGEPKRHGT